MNISFDGVHNLCTSFFQQKVYFLFIALKRIETFERRWCQTYGLGVKNSFL